ncbi:MAG: glycosyltransferase family 4 protein [Woeseiaceae bacterium]
MSRRFDLCFVGLKCYDLLADKAVPKYLGGIERVFVALAKSLSASGLKVAFVTYDEGQNDVDLHDGITVFKAHGADAGVPVLRLLHPRMTAIWRAMKKADARYYLQMGAGVETLAVAFAVRGLIKDARFVYCVASNLDCEKDLRGIRSVHERFLYSLGLRQAHSIVAQTERQAAMLQENFGLGSHVIPMPCEVLSTESNGDTMAGNGVSVQTGSGRASASNGPLNVLWVGRTVAMKRLEWLLDLALLMPEAEFHVIGTANQDSEYSKGLVVRARQLANVHVYGRLSQADLVLRYRSAFVLCCTSSLEGFPTTFLEAWKVGVPVVTTFDPDRIVERMDVGISVATIPELQRAILQLQGDSKLYDRLSRNSEGLYRNQYSPEAIVRQYLEFISSGNKERWTAG